MRLAQVLAPVVDLVFPPRCPLCGDAIAQQSGLCGDCWNAFVMPGEPSCVRCSRPFTQSVASGTVCAPCLGNEPRHDGLYAGALYNDASRRLVLAYKHGSRLSLASIMAGMLAYKMTFVEDDWLIIPVPLHRWRLWGRGYNQSAVLARAIGSRVGGTLAVDALQRRKATPRLGGLGGKARKRALSGAIGVAPGWKSRLKGAQVVLVDDVFTSGATSDACVSALKRAGASKVVIACFARVMDEALPHGDSVSAPASPAQGS